jgi:transcriptional regulator with XRE-family HTH domain
LHPVAFGAFLVRRRVELKWTTEAFAVAADLPDAATVTKMEQGEREPTLTELFKIANALRTPQELVRAQQTADAMKSPIR